MASLRSGSTSEDMRGGWSAWCMISIWASPSMSGRPPARESRAKETSFGRGFGRGEVVSSRDNGGEKGEEADSLRPRDGGEDMMWQRACAGHAMGSSAGDDVVRPWELTVVRVGETVIGQARGRGQWAADSQTQVQAQAGGIMW